MESIQEDFNQLQQQYQELEAASASGAPQPVILPTGDGSSDQAIAELQARVQQLQEETNAANAKAAAAEVSKKDLFDKFSGYKERVLKDRNTLQANLNKEKEERKAEIEKLLAEQAQKIEEATAMLKAQFAPKEAELNAKIAELQAKLDAAPAGPGEGAAPVVISDAEAAEKIAKLEEELTIARSKATDQEGIKSIIKRNVAYRLGQEKEKWEKEREAAREVEQKEKETAHAAALEAAKESARAEGAMRSKVQLSMLEKRNKDLMEKLKSLEAQANVGAAVPATPATPAAATPATPSQPKQPPQQQQQQPPAAAQTLAAQSAPQAAAPATQAAPANVAPVAEPTASKPQPIVITTNQQPPAQAIPQPAFGISTQPQQQNIQPAFGIQSKPPAARASLPAQTHAQQQQQAGQGRPETPTGTGQPGQANSAVQRRDVGTAPAAIRALRGNLAGAGGSSIPRRGAFQGQPGAGRGIPVPASSANAAAAQSTQALQAQQAQILAQINTAAEASGEPTSPAGSATSAGGVAPTTGQSAQGQGRGSHLPRGRGFGARGRGGAAAAAGHGAQAGAQGSTLNVQARQFVPSKRGREGEEGDGGHDGQQGAQRGGHGGKRGRGGHHQGGN